MFVTLESLRNYVTETRNFGRWLKADALSQLERAHNLVRPAKAVAKANAQHDEGARIEAHAVAVWDAYSSAFDTHLRPIVRAEEDRTRAFLSQERMTLVGIARHDATPAAIDAGLRAASAEIARIASERELAA